MNPIILHFFIPLTATYILCCLFCRKRKREQPKAIKTTAQHADTPPVFASSGNASIQASAQTASRKITMSDITFDQIAGYSNTKKAMQFIVGCLTHRETLQAVGAVTPRGILLYGPPGTGKTMFAKAIAGSAKVPFLSANASQFTNVYVGKGASNVRALYQEARRNAPCIVFIDEIDAIGCQRSGQTNEERRQTLNAILAEIDGMDSASNIITIAATNTLEDLDTALMRPGRFDRKIAIPLPNEEDRFQLLKFYMQNKQVDVTVSIQDLARRTEGMSCAGIATVVNEAAIQAAYQNRVILTQSDFEFSLFQQLTNGEQKISQNLRERTIVAYHEAGHALAAKLLTTDIIPTVTIIGSTSGAGGLTFRHAKEEYNFISKKDLENLIQIYYAGRAGEELFFGNTDDITNGASSDLRAASKLIHEYIVTYGMGKHGLLNTEVFTGQQDAGSIIEAQKLAEMLYAKVKVLLQEHSDAFFKIASELLEKDTLHDEDLCRIVNRPAPNCSRSDCIVTNP